MYIECLLVSVNKDDKMKTIHALKTYTVIYRDGGTLNFQWHRVLELYTDYTQASYKAIEIERMGYKSLVFNTKALNNIGLPTSY
jgi:hypothetical protein